MRRVSSIALVHETLSESIDESVDFDEIVDRLLGMVSDVAGSRSRIRMKRGGSFGVLPAEIATALVLVITELVQNALEHAFESGDDGVVDVLADRQRGQLIVTIKDDGRGLPPDFGSVNSDRLGLQIVRTLVSAELGGTVELRSHDGGTGTAAVVTMSLGHRSRVGG